MKNKLTLILVFCVTLILTSCENKVAEKLEGSWRLVSMETSGFTISGRELNDPVLTMTKDNKYMIFIDGKLENGTWKAKGNEFFLIGDKGKEETALKIDSLTDNTLIYHNKAGKDDVKVYYTKIHSEEEEEEEGH
jgi:hypothetical protein